MQARIYAAVAALAVAGFFAGIALSQAPPTEPNPRADINADGDFNSGDQGILAQQIISGATVSINPCVPYVVIDDAHPYPTDGPLVINTLSTVVTPAYGGAYRIPPEHPAYTVLASGSPWPLRSCP